MSFLGRLKNDVEGLSLLKDWLGEGGAVVPINKAIERAETCANHKGTGKPCPENVEPGWWDRFKLGVAEIIRNQLELKKKLGVKTPQDEHLSMCRACGCCLPLKVHVPIAYIVEHTNKNTLNKFPSFCWIAKEYESYLFKKGTSRES